MAEVKKELPTLAGYLGHSSHYNDYVITADHTLADVVRWLIKETNDPSGEEIFYILRNETNDFTGVPKESDDTNIK